MNEPPHAKRLLIAYENSKGSDKTAHAHAQS